MMVSPQSNSDLKNLLTSDIEEKRRYRTFFQSVSVRIMLEVALLIGRRQKKGFATRRGIPELSDIGLGHQLNTHFLGSPYAISSHQQRRVNPHFWAQEFLCEPPLDAAGFG